MNREILFKAKRKDNNKWVYGYFIKNPFDQCFIFEIKDKRYTNWNHEPLIEVIPETICQYTGLTDKNGKKIFENDIVKLKYQGEDEDTRPEKTCVMNFKENQWCVNSKHLDGFTMNIYTREVIGNIFDEEVK